MSEIELILENLKFEIGMIEPLKNSKEKIVLGTGNFNAPILFIGDDGELYLDENYKVSFGSSGEFLMRLCDVTGILPENYYITTLTKSKKHYRELEESDKKIVKDCLMTQISLINPKLIVAFGTDVAELLLEKEIKFLEERGKIKSWKGGIDIIITYDVNFAKKSRDDSGKRSKPAVDFWSDLKLIKDIINSNI